MTVSRCQVGCVGVLLAAPGLGDGKGGELVEIQVHVLEAAGGEEAGAAVAGPAVHKAEAEPGGVFPGFRIYEKLHGGEEDGAGELEVAGDGFELGPGFAPHVEFGVALATQEGDDEVFEGLGGDDGRGHGKRGVGVFVLPGLGVLPV